MARATNWTKVLLYVLGLVLISVTIVIVTKQPHVSLLRNLVQKEFELVEGRQGYETIWLKVELDFRVYLFDVQNPAKVMQGAKPELIERGPYVYSMFVKKDVLNIDEELDELEHLTTRTYHFDPFNSNGTEDDEITMIHPAYMGIMGTISASFPTFLKTMGNNIPKLFPGMKDIFVRGKVGDILFYGLPMECDMEKYKQLKMICGFLAGKKPPIIRDTDTEGVYQWSFFERMNGTADGPFTVNRGVKNKSRLGDTTSFKGLRVQKYWRGPECNTVMGTDAITWPPLDQPLDYVYAYEPQICRTVSTKFDREVIMHGLVGRRYRLDSESWRAENIVCYCPVVKKKPVCPPTGLMDLTPCQQAPIYYSEPHFLHGDPMLREYAKNLDPNPEKHAAYITIEPMSGIPLSGSKKLQLNAKIFNNPGVEFLANVTEGYFPILWVDEGKDADIKELGKMLQTYRLARLLEYVIYIPLTIGIFIVLRTFFVHLDLRTPVKFEEYDTADSVLVGHNPRIKKSEMTVVRRTRARIN